MTRDPDGMKHDLSIKSLAQKCVYSRLLETGKAEIERNASKCKMPAISETTCSLMGSLGFSLHGTENTMRIGHRRLPLLTHPKRQQHICFSQRATPLVVWSVKRDGPLLGPSGPSSWLCSLCVTPPASPRFVRVPHFGFIPCSLEYFNRS